MFRHVGHGLLWSLRALLSVSDTLHSEASEAAVEVEACGNSLHRMGNTPPGVALGAPGPVPRKFVGSEDEKKLQVLRCTAADASTRPMVARCRGQAVVVVDTVLSAIDEALVAEVGCMVKEEWYRDLVARSAMADV